MNNGSRDSLKVSLRWGLSANARQTRPTVEALRPQARTIDSGSNASPPAALSRASGPRRVRRPRRSPDAARPGAVRPASRRSRCAGTAAATCRPVARVVPRACGTAWSLRPAALCSTMRARRPESARGIAPAQPTLQFLALRVRNLRYLTRVFDNGSARPSSLPGRTGPQADSTDPITSDGGQ